MLGAFHSQMFFETDTLKFCTMVKCRKRNFKIKSKAAVMFKFAGKKSLYFGLVPVDRTGKENHGPVKPRGPH